MITIDLNHPLQDLDGNPIADSNLGKNMAAQLVTVAHGNVVKHYDWALALHRGKPIEVDQADLDYLKKLVEDSASITILGKKQILDLMVKSKPD